MYTCTVLTQTSTYILLHDMLFIVMIFNQYVLFFPGNNNHTTLHIPVYVQYIQQPSWVYRESILKAIMLPHTKLTAWLQFKKAKFCNCAWAQRFPRRKVNSLINPCLSANGGIKVLLRLIKVGKYCHLPQVCWTYNWTLHISIVDDAIALGLTVFVYKKCLEYITTTHVIIIFLLKFATIRPNLYQWKALMFCLSGLYRRFTDVY